MTHNQLVKEAAQWLRGTRRCSVVACELTTIISEIPDVIGWVDQLSILVECKTSRADFLADSKKLHRFGYGIGLERWFYIPEGIINQNEVPDGWGLLERKSFGERHICKQSKVASLREPNLEIAMRERRFLVSLAWRACEAASFIKPITITDNKPIE